MDSHPAVVEIFRGADNNKTIYYQILPDTWYSKIWIRKSNHLKHFQNLRNIFNKNILKGEFPKILQELI